MISQAGVELVKAFEGLKLLAYADPGTHGAPWTIGFGHATGVHEGDACTLEDADRWLQEDLATAETCLDAWVDVDLTDNQKAALASFVFNLGCQAFMGSTLRKLLNAGNYAACPAQFKRWNTSAGKVMAGLTRRRAAESALFSTA